MPWVMGVARHKLVDHYRRTARAERHLALMWSDTAETLENDLLDVRDPARALELLHNLSAEHRLVLILKYVDELSAQEISSMLNRSLDATNSLLSRARRALAANLTEDPT